MTLSHSDSVRDRGFAIIRGILSVAECRAILNHQSNGQAPAPLEWWKGRGASDPFYFGIANKPRLVDLAKSVLGLNVILWGVDVLRRKPNQVHPWHCDIESSRQEGGFLSVWIGVENVNRLSALNFVSRSHNFGITIQEKMFRLGMQREEVSESVVESWAKSIDSLSETVAPDISEGDAIAFDGRLWHGTHNLNSEESRVALLLQYAAADCPVRLFDPKRVDWPLTFITDRLPPVVVVCGEGDPSKNRIVDAPTKFPAITNAIHPLQLPLATSDKGWVPYPLFHGHTPHLRFLSCHVSALGPGHSPHPPHQHEEEEILVVLDGEAEVVLPRSQGDPKPQIRKLGKGSFAYYPAWEYHTIRNSSDAPVTYLMFKWIGAMSANATPEAAANVRLRAEAVKRPLFTCIIDCMEQLTGASDEPPLVFDMPTIGLRRLHCHVTRMPSGGGYPFHRDGHDVALVLVAGTIQTQRQSLEGGGVAWFSAGEPHDMLNPSGSDAAYIAFEFEA